MVKIDDFEIIGSEYERIQRLTDKGFISNGELNTKFYAVYKMYSDYFLDFIDDTIKLKSYDDALSEKKLLPKIEEEYMDVYQRFSKYEYFYIRNYLAIEKLDDDYIEEKKPDGSVLYSIVQHRNWKGSEGTDLAAIIDNYISIGVVSNVR